MSYRRAEMSLWKRKPLEQLLHAQIVSEEDPHELKKTLGPFNLIALGIGAIIGAGLFVRTAAAAAEQRRPVGDARLRGRRRSAARSPGLCYAEFASMIPIAGSAYTYSYATMGELVAWIIGWDLVLEYAHRRRHGRHRVERVPQQAARVPARSPHDPVRVVPLAVRVDREPRASHGIMNVPALFIVLMLTLLLIRGMKESAFVNGIIVITKVTIVILIIVLGWSFIDPANHTPYIPDADDRQGRAGRRRTTTAACSGILGAAGIVFFAFIGFDAVSTAAQETKNPKRDMPIGILGSLVDLHRALHPVRARAHRHRAGRRLPQRRQRGVGRLRHHARTCPATAGSSKLVTVAILVGFSSVILVMLMGQSRVFFSMSRDGLVPKVFSRRPPEVPHAVQVEPRSSSCSSALFAAFVPGDIVGDMTTHRHAVRVHARVHRRVGDARARSRRAAPVPGADGAASSDPRRHRLHGLMIFGLGWPNWARLGVWLVDRPRHLLRLRHASTRSCSRKARAEPASTRTVVDCGPEACYPGLPLRVSIRE